MENCDYIKKDVLRMAERTIGTDVNQIEITSLSKIRGQKKVTDLLKVNLDAYFQSRQTGNTGTFGPALLCGPFPNHYMMNGVRGHTMILSFKRKFLNVVSQELVWMVLLCFFILRGKMELFLM